MRPISYGQSWAGRLSSSPARRSPTRNNESRTGFRVEPRRPAEAFAAGQGVRAELVERRVVCCLAIVRDGTLRVSAEFAEVSQRRSGDRVRGGTEDVAEEDPGVRSRARTRPRPAEERGPLHRYRHSLLRREGNPRGGSGSATSSYGTAAVCVAAAFDDPARPDCEGDRQDGTDTL